MVKTAAILPTASIPKLQPWLRRANYKLCTLSENPFVAVVDFTHQEALQDIGQLRTNKKTLSIGVLAVIDDHCDAREVLDAGADGFVATGCMEREFVLRLEAVRQVAFSRLEQARREKNLAVLLNLTAHYAAALDVATLLHDVTRRLAEELSIDRCALVLIDEQNGLGHIVAASDDSAIRDLRIELARYPEIREAVRTDVPVVVEDVGSHPLLGEVKEMVAQRGIASLAAVPLTVQQKTLGVLLLRSSAGVRFSPQEISFAWTVAHATAIALRNVRMLEGLRGQAEQAEAQVAELARYADFFQYVSDGIVILDKNGKIISLNPAAVEVLGLSVDQAKGKYFTNYADSSSEEAMTQMLRKSGRGLVCRDIDLEVKRLDQIRLTLSVCASPVQGGRTILSFRDVTAQRATEKELRRTKEFLERLIDSSGEAIVAADQAGKVVLLNRSAERIFGFTASEARGIQVDKLYLQLSPQEMHLQLMSLMRSEDKQIRQMEQARGELRTKKGETVPVLMSAASIFVNEEPIASVALFSDLRERTQLEAKLWHAQEKLKEAEKHAVVLEFAGATAHELNQPLTAVMGWAEMLKLRLIGKDDDPAHKQPVEIILREAERMKEIVRKIGKTNRHETKPYVGDTRIIDFEAASVDLPESGDSFSPLGAMVLLSREVAQAANSDKIYAIVYRWLEAFFPQRFRRVLISTSGTHSAKTIRETQKTSAEQLQSLYRVPLVASNDSFGELVVELSEPQAHKMQEKDVVDLISFIVGSRLQAIQCNSELCLAKKYFDELLDNVQMLALVTSRRHRIIIMNKALEDFLGCPRDKFINQPVEQLVEESEQKSLREIWEKSIQGNRCHPFEIAIKTAKNSAKKVLFSLSAIRDGAGNVVKLMALGQDISRQKEMEWRIAQAEKLASLGQLAAGVAHEINNPLSTITMYTESLLQTEKRGSFQPAELEKLFRIKESANRISHFAQELTNYARPSSNCIEVLDLQEVLEEAIRYCEPSLKECGTFLDRKYSPMPRIKGVRAQLVQVFVNLCINACHSLSDKEGRIEVSSCSREEGSVIKISDTGSGIRDEDLPKIFEPFFSTKPEGRGTGLGLPIVQNIVQKHGGTIQVASQQGKGTTFTVWFPGFTDRSHKP